MAVPRMSDAAVRLADGEVLFEGGYDYANDCYVNTSELDDPKAGVFRPTGSLESVRVDATATLLTDGRVLVAGGGVSGGGSDYDTSTELYWP